MPLSSVSSPPESRWSQNLSSHGEEDWGVGLRDYQQNYCYEQSHSRGAVSRGEITGGGVTQDETSGGVKGKITEIFSPDVFKPSLLEESEGL